MDISTLHGFLSALISGPVVLPAEWLPHALAAPTPLFSSAEEAGRVFGLIARFSNGIALQLRDDPLNFRPLLYSDDSRGDADSVMPEPWCMGYGRGVSLRAQAWEPVTREPLLAGLFEAIATIATRDDEDPPPGGMLDNLMAHESMYLVLAGATIAIYLRWQQEPEQPARQMVNTEFPFAVPRRPS
jgi:yecA family protein